MKNDELGKTTRLKKTNWQRISEEIKSQERGKNKPTPACPPLAHQPRGISQERAPYHSLIQAFPNITAPALLYFSTTIASLAASNPSSANDPIVVFILSLVAMLSFTITGTPWSFPSGNLPPQWVCCLSLSALSAWYHASGFTSSTLWSRGLRLSTQSV